MAERVEKVSLVAEVTSYLAGMEKARVATEKAGTEAEQAAKKLSAQREAFSTVGPVIAGAGLAIVAGVAVAVAKFAEFDAQMSQVKSLSHATGDEMRQLTDAALHLGQGIGFSATEVADAETELVKAGVAVKDIVGGSLVGALNLAAAGQIGVAEATQIAGVAMTQFKLAGKDVPHLADLLAAGADKALGGVEQLGQALNQSGLVAAQFGLSIEDTVGTLSAFAQAGLLGSDAGTSFKTMLQQLASPSKQASDELKKYNINAYDAKGNFVGITALAGNLQKGLSGVTAEQRNAALSIIFGNDAVRAANVLYENGSSGIKKWIRDVDDSGFAAQQAAGKMDNLKGDISKLSASIDTDLIQSGSGANDVLRGLVQGLTGLANAVGDIPAPALTTGLAIAGVTGAILLSTGAVVTGIPKYAAFVGGLNTLGLSAKAAGFAVGGLSLAVTAGVAVVGLLIQQQAEATARVEAYASSLEAGTNRITKATRELAKEALATKPKLAGMFDIPNAVSAYDAARKLGFSLSTVTDAALGNAAALEKYRDRVKEITKLQAEAANGNRDAQKAIDTRFGGDQAVANLSVVTNAVKGQNESLNEAVRIAKQKEQADKDAADASNGSTDATGKNSAALQELAGKATSAGQSVDDLAAKIKGFGSAQLDVNSTQRDFQAAIDAATQAVKDNGTSLDITTEKGRNNSSALDQIASSALAAAAAKYQQSGSEKEAADQIQAGRDALIAQLGQYGITGQAAQDYADKLGLIPANVSTLIVANTDPATLALQKYKAFLDSLPAEKVFEFKARANTQNLPGTSQGYGFAEGGYTGDGAKYQPVGVVHAAEFVSTKETTAHPSNRAVLEFMQRGGVMRGYANGGYVRGSGGTSSGGNVYNETTTITAPQITDPAVLASVLGREIARGRR